MKVVILCGGLGTRLRQETEFRPKPLVEIGRHPVLWHIMKIYAHFGFTEFILCLGYRGNMLKDYFLNYQAMNNDFTLRLGDGNRITYYGTHEENNFTVTLVDTGLDTATGGRVARIRRFIEGDTFMVTYGDGLIDVDLRKVLAFHRRHCKIATVTAVRPTSRYGSVDVDADGAVARFAEKPQENGWVSAGYFVFDVRMFDFLRGDDCVLEGDPLERLAAEGQLMAYKHTGFFYAMDTYREYLHLNELWNSGQAPWKVWPSGQSCVGAAE